MPAIVTDDGVTLHAEETGQGEPLLFVHEFAGDHRSWEPQVRFFSASYRCVTYAARGYLPSDVPTDPDMYSQARAIADAVAVLDGLQIGQAHLVGLSMGGFTALHLAMAHPDRVRSAVVAGAGYGAEPEHAEAFRAESVLAAAAFAAEGAAKVAERYALGPARVQFQNKNPRGWAEFAAALAAHSSLGSALTMRGVQAARPSLYGPDPGRRRGRGLPGTRAYAQADHPHGRPGRPAAHRAHRQPGRTRRLQPRRRRLPRQRGPWRLASPRPEVPVGVRPGHELTAVTADH